MAYTSFSNEKVHNEIELCSVVNFEIKKQLERLFLENGISYCERWDNPGFLKKIFGGGSKARCIICINEMQKDTAMDILLKHKEIKSGIEMIDKPVDRTFF